MIPSKIQNAQIGALSADKTFQSVKHAPHTAQRVFEEEIKKQISDAQERTEAAEKSEKGHIRDEDSNFQNQQQKREAKGGTEEDGGKKDGSSNFIEKSQNGTIKHLDVKI